MILSIITVNLNNVHGLTNTMDSIIMQSCKEFEWIVIDGGSTDGSVELLEQNTSIIDYWVSEPDHGIYSAMNKGISSANGDYLLFMNSGDCLANESVIESFCNAMVYTDFIVGYSSMEGIIESPGNGMPLDSTEDILFRLCVSAFPHQATFIRRDTFAKYGLYREDFKLASDWYFTVNALIKGSATVSYVPIFVSICEKDGVSSLCRRELYQERKTLIRENPYFATLFDFYSDNREIVAALKHSRLFFFLFRVYYFIYRHLRKPLS